MGYIFRYFHRFIPRLGGWALIALALMLLLSYEHPQQMGVVLYKCALVTLAAVLGYWVDRSMFPYARPHKQIRECEKECIGHSRIQLVPTLLMMRRAVIVLACILGLTLGM